jgi:hypothetical protein
MCSIVKLLEKCELFRSARVKPFRRFALWWGRHELRLLRTSFIFILVILTSCVSRTSGGMRHTFILGFGVVSTTITNELATVSRLQAIGLVVNGQKTVFGAVSDLTTVVHTNADIVIEVTKTPLSPLRVNVPPR